MLTYAPGTGLAAADHQRLELGVLVRQVVEEIARCAARCWSVARRGALVPEELGELDRGRAAPPHRALQNLLTNTLRHADRPVRVSYRVSLERCRVDVEGRRAGGAGRNGERLFTPFLRLDDSRTRASGGHGLGLSIVQRIVYWHGSRASIGRSETLGGACFTWPGRARRVCATAESRRKIWRLAICKCMRRRIPSRSENISKGQSRRRGEYSARG